MAKSQRQPKARKPDETRAALLDAAEREFNGPGFFETDSNRIARAAGYAPQTFYRHFADKTEIFLAVYDRWWRHEGRAIAVITSPPRRRGKKPGEARPRESEGRSGPLRSSEPDRVGAASYEDIADIVIAFHTKWRIFRRALRHLSVVDPRVRKARAEARLAQLATLPGRKNESDGEHAANLFRLERLADAAAEGEFADMGLNKSAARAAVIEAVKLTHGG